MNKQPNCPYCKSEKFAIVTHTFGIVKNDKKEDCYLETELLCCDECKAVICQYDKSLNNRKVI